MVEQQRVVDMADRHAVVIDDNNALTLFVDFLAFQQALLVGIHHNQQRAGRDNIQGLVRQDEVVFLACIDESLQQRACQSGVAVDGDGRRDAADLADAQHTDGRADGIQVAHAVAHNDDAVTLFDKVAQGVGDDTAAHMTALFDTVGDTSVEFKAVYGLDSRLVAASA